MQVIYEGVEEPRAGSRDTQNPTSDILGKGVQGSRAFLTKKAPTSFLHWGQKDVNTGNKHPKWLVNSAAWLFRRRLHVVSEIFAPDFPEKLFINKFPFNGKCKY